jgi:hypothetical protein
MVTSKWSTYMAIKYIPLLIFLIILNIDRIPAQSSDINKLNSFEFRKQIKQSGIKSKTIWEYRWETQGNTEVLSDSGYKSSNTRYDNDGKITEYTKFHIFSDLTIKEVYSFYKTNNLSHVNRYNSAGDVIETIDYVYGKVSGKLLKENHTSFLNQIRPGIYYTIIANINDDSLFSRLQDDFQIEPKLQSYMITVNISDPEELNQYVVIGDESDATSPRFSWSQLTLENQRGLLAYTGPNKKEHTYLNKFLSHIDYKYDSKYNLVGKETYNTSNDLLEKESYRYDSRNNKIAFYKYNEKGNVSSLEYYAYDSTGRLSETRGVDPSGRQVSRIVYKYDDYNNPVEKLWYGAGGEVNGITKYSYDSNNKLTEETRFRGESEKESRTKFIYDNNSNLLEMIRYNSEDRKEKSTKYVWE